MKRFWSKLLLAGLSAVALGGCAEGMGDINRVQPNYYSKSQFQGDWYFKQTVIDVPYENSWLFEGLGSDIEKIHWELQEDALIAYRRNELVLGANGEPDDGTPKFTPVAAYAITKHFDILRGYNAATGEQTNVIDENTTDRPWYERDYIRVDWSRNLVPNGNGLDFIVPLIGFNGVSYWVQDHEKTNPDRFEISDDYIGVVGRFAVEPDMWACYLSLNDVWTGTGSGGNCGPTTIKIRSSFVKIDPDTPKYEPLVYGPSTELVPSTDANGDGKVNADDAIGRVLAICSETYTQNDQIYCGDYAYVPCTQEVIDGLNQDPLHRQFGFTMDDCDWVDEPQMFGKFGYFRTEHLTYDRQWGHTDSNIAYFANRWNIWKKSYDDNGNLLPYAEREVQPVVYYLNPDFPADLYEAAEEIERQWNEAFKRTVAGVQNKSADEIPDVFQIEPNSCSPQKLEEYVSKTKGASAVVKSVIGSLDNLDNGNMEQLCSALEYELGFHWQKNGDLRYSYVYWVNRPQMAGPLGFGPSYADPDTGQLINGTAYVYGAGVDRYANTATEIVEFLAGRITEDEVIGGDTMRSNVRENFRKYMNERQHVSDEFMDRLGQRREALSMLPNKGLTPVPAGHYDGRLERIKDTSWEKEIFLQSDLVAGLVPGYENTGDIPREILDQISPATALSRKQNERREKRIQQLTSKHCAYMEEFADPSVIGLAMEYDAAGKTRDQIYADLRRDIFIGVMLHEVGHTLGLRHNFEGSVDALNYDDKFWEYAQLPSNPIVARAQVEDADIAARLDACNERAQEWGYDIAAGELTTLDCLQASELKQASIMDYGAKFNSDFLGVGKYDKAAIAFGYGQLVEVFDDSVPMPAANNMSRSLRDHLFFTDYKKIPTEGMLGSVENISKRNLKPYKELNTARADAIVAAGAALPRFNAQLQCVENCDYSLFNDGREVPYQFCSDDYAYWSSTCKRWDEGANQTEIIGSMINSYRNYYPFWNFKRDRFNWTHVGYLNTLYDRVFRHINLSYQYYFYYGDSYYGATDWMKDYATASINGLNLLAEVIQTPEPGMYYWCPQVNEYVHSVYNCRSNAKPAVNIPVGQGRYYWHDFESDGYYWRLARAGTVMEKQYALNVLANSDARFYGVASTAENYSINFYQLFKGEILDLLGGVLTDDNAAAGGRIVINETGPVDTAEYKPRKLVDPVTMDLPEAPVAEGEAIMPRYNQYWTKWQTALYGMALLNSSLDYTLDFRNYFRVSIKGSNEDIEYPDEIVNNPDLYAEVTDPTSHVTYRAAATDDGHSFGLKMVKAAKEMYDTEWVPAKEALAAAEANLDPELPPPGWNYDEALAAYNEAKTEFEFWDQQLNGQLGWMNDFRAFQYIFSYTLP